MGKIEEFEKLAARHASDENWDPKERKEISAFAKKNKISQLNVNLGYARMAVQFARQKITTTANHDMLQPGSYDNHFMLTGQADPSKFKKEDACVNILVRDNADWRANSKINALPQNQRLNGLQKIRELATSDVMLNGTRVQTNCGNCVELSAVAFTFLHRLGVKPLDYFSLTPYTARIDHVFVVIGRKRDADPKKPNVDPWDQWNDDAVVCDPWTPGLRHPPGNTPVALQRFGDSYGAYSVKMLRYKMSQAFPGFRGVFLEHREA